MNIYIKGLNTLLHNHTCRIDHYHNLIPIHHLKIKSKYCEVDQSNNVDYNIYYIIISSNHRISPQKVIYQCMTNNINYERFWYQTLASYFRGAYMRFR